jgi:hypothetical protein
MLERKKCPGKGIVMFIVLSMFFCFLLNAQQKEAVKAKKVFKIQPDRLMEQVMVSLEFNDIFITAYDLKKGTVVTEYKKLTLEKMQEYTTIDLKKAAFDVFRYQVKTRVRGLEGEAVVEVSTVLKAYGRRFKNSGARPHWYTLQSNGELEKKIAGLIDVKKRGVRK